MQFTTVVRIFIFAILALVAFAEYDDTPLSAAELDYYANYVKKGGPQGPLRFGKRRGPSGPLRFGKRSMSPIESHHNNMNDDARVWAVYNNN